MNALRMNTGAGLLRLFRGTIAVVSLALAATSAHATCGFTGIGGAGAIKMPMLQAESEALAASQGLNPSVVGLWYVIYTANNAVFNETLDTWHSDGTEFENAYLPVLNGNICEGVWKSTGKNTVRLHHLGWTYDPVKGGLANGTFTVDQNNTIAWNGQSYTGTFVFKAYDMTGKLLETIPGTLVAVRITVE
jgi:hypothetical protein